MTATQKKYSYGFRVQPINNDSEELQYQFYMDAPPIRVISFKGGGTRVIVYTKFVEMAQRKGLLSKVEEVGGSSSGCIAAVFTAIHYENPLARSTAIDAINNCDRTDIFGTSPGWKIYRILSLPLYLVSKPLEWISKGIGLLAGKLNSSTPGEILGYPLLFISKLIGAVSTVTSPRAPAGLFNLIVGGGVYRGVKVQETICNRIQLGVQTGLDAILSKLDEKERARIISHLHEVKLVTPKKGGRFSVTANVTFRHMYELSLLPGSQFKQCYVTAVRVKDKSLVIFNNKNNPDMPLHTAIRLGISFPAFYQLNAYKGHKYFDGGAIDNAPVSLATPKNLSAFELEHGLSDNFARLNVRVEYPKDYEFHLWKEAPRKGWLGRLGYAIVSAIAKVFTLGIDSYATDQEGMHEMVNDFPHRTLQLPDFNVGRMQNSVSAEDRKWMDAQLVVKIHDFFHAYKIHRDGAEKAVIEFYPYQFVNKPNSLEMRKHLIAYLKDQDIPTSDIFKIPGKTAEELEAMRVSEVAALEAMTGPFDGYSSEDCRDTSVLRYVNPLSTNVICHALETLPQAVLTRQDVEKMDAVTAKVNDKNYGSLPVCASADITPVTPTSRGLTAGSGN